MEIYGKIITVLPERSGVSARGNQWRSVTYVLETQEQYPKKLAFDVVNDRIDLFAIQVGEFLTVQFEINAREFNQKWFNSVQAWNVVRQQPQGNMPPQGGYQQPPQGGYQQGGQQWGANNSAAGAQAAAQAQQQAMRSAVPNGQPAGAPPPAGDADDLPF